MRRSPARFLAPIALVAFAVAFYSVLHETSDPVGPNSSEVTATPSATKTASKKSKKRSRTYTVRSGDTPSGIAEKAGISLETLLELNPKLNPQTLTPGQRLKLSE